MPIPLLPASTDRFMKTDVQMIYTGVLIIYQFSSVAKSCPILYKPMDCSPPSSSVHGISQARILDQFAISISRALSTPRSPALQADSLPSEPPGKRWFSPSLGSFPFQPGRLPSNCFLVFCPVFILHTAANIDFC